MNEIYKQDNVRVSHLNTSLQVDVNGDTKVVDEKTQRATFREIENEYYNFKYRVAKILDRIK